MAAATLDLIAPERFGPSDQDRDAWLAFRRPGITATEIRDLYTGEKTIPLLVAEKLGRRSVTFGGNRYTAWGNVREPVIAAHIAEHFGINPESRVLRDAVDPRRLASPDGIGRYGLGDEVCVSEIKTSGVPIPVGSPAFEKKGYLAQMVWTMLRAGAAACLYAWELRDEIGGQFVPGELTFEWVYLDDHRFLGERLEQIGDEFLQALDEAASEPWEEPAIDEDLDTLAVNVLAARVAESEGKTAKEAAWSSLLARLGERGGDFQQESVLARITYTAAHEVTTDVVDTEAAKAANPELWESLEILRAQWSEHAAAFTKPHTTTKAAGLTVTAVKPKGSKS